MNSDIDDFVSFGGLKSVVAVVAATVVPVVVFAVAVVVVVVVVNVRRFAFRSGVSDVDAVSRIVSADEEPRK